MDLKDRQQDDVLIIECREENLATFDLCWQCGAEL